MLSQNIEWDFNGRHTKRVQTLIFFPSDKQCFSALFGLVFVSCVEGQKYSWKVSERNEREKTTALTRHWKILPYIWLNEATYSHWALLTSLGTAQGQRRWWYLRFPCKWKMWKVFNRMTWLTHESYVRRSIFRLAAVLLSACGIDDMLFETIGENPQHFSVRLRPAFLTQIFQTTCPLPPPSLLKLRKSTKVK